MSLANPQAFFDQMRAGLLGPILTAQEVDGCNAVLSAMGGCPRAYTAYALATAYHETASTMMPIREYGGTTYFTRMYDISGARPQKAAAMGNTAPGDGPKYCGRGYVQLTWKSNYRLAGDKLGVDLVSYPDKAMEPAIAAKIMRHSMTDGWFTGRKFSSYLPATGPASRTEFIEARRIINGTDKASQIADHALAFQQALEAGGWL